MTDTIKHPIILKNLAKQLASLTFNQKVSIVGLTFIAVAIPLSIFLTIGKPTNIAPKAAGNTITINPVQINDYISNPGIGWQAMTYSTPLILPETVAYANRADVSWKILNPGDGVYDWTALDTRLNQAVSQGKMFSFRIYTMRGEIFGGHQVPQWAVNKGVKIVSNAPNYHDCSYQEEWSKMVEAIRQRYDGNQNIAFIDISGYGNFNEWSWQDGITEFDDDALNPTTLDGQSRKRLADMFIGGSGTTACTNSSGQQVTASYSYPGFTQTQIVMPYAGIRQSAQYVANKKPDTGIRHDCLGRSGSYQGIVDKIDAQIKSTWSKAPIIYELCDVNWGNSTWINEVDKLLKYSHGSIIHDNPTGSVESGQAEPLFKLAGYRYSLKSISYPESALPSETINVSMNWQNLGYAPSYPKMGQNFKLFFYLYNQSGQLAKTHEIGNANISSWMPADPIPGTAPDNQISAASLSLSDLAPGLYNTKVAIVDTRTSLPINLAIQGKDSNGHYNIGQILITSPQATPTPTPSPSPTPNPTPEATWIDLRSDGFETNDFSQWDQTNAASGTLTIINHNSQTPTLSNGGAKVAKAYQDGSSATDGHFSRTIWELPNWTDQIYRTEAMFYLPTGFYNSMMGAVQLIGWDTNPTLGNQMRLAIYNNDKKARLFIQEDYVGRVITDNFAIPEDQWVKLVIEQKISATGGWSKVYMNDALMAQGSADYCVGEAVGCSDTATNYPVTRLRYGLVAIADQIQLQPVTVYFDEVKLQTGSETATPSPTPTISPTPSPTPTITASSSPTTTCYMADINKDSIVNLVDRDILISDFFIASGRSDLNSDNFVDITDYSLWIKDLGKTSICP